MSNAYMMTDDEAAARANVRAFVNRVFMWMTVAMIVTASVAAWTAQTPSLLAVVLSGNVIIGLLIAEVGLVMLLSWLIARLSPAVAAGAFLLYATLNGLTLSVIFLAYTTSSIASTFFVTAGTFGVMAVIGFTTRRDLTSLGSLLMMALIGMILASLVNWLFFRSEMIYWAMTYLGIAIFVGLIAYDTQKIKRMAVLEGTTEGRKAAIIGALAIYLDFINLFLLLLRLLGRRR